MEIYLPIAGLPINFFILMSLGLVVGFLSGMFGVGGGFLMTPMLMLLGIPPAVAVASEASDATATAGGIPRSISIGVIKKPPPTPNIPDKKPTTKPRDINIKKLIGSPAIGRYISIN